MKAAVSLILVFVLCLRMLVSILSHPLRIGWDPSLHLQCAELITRGKIPYVDMFDVNPPLIWYLDTIPALIAAALHWPQTLTFNLCLLVVIAYCGLSLSYIINKKPAFEGQDMVMLGILAGALFFNFQLRYDFGQREEIFVLLYLPYLFLRYSRYRGAPIGSREAIFFGVAGALGICLKHYFLLVAVLVELAMLLAWGGLKKLLAPENYAALAFALLYLGHFLLAPTAMKDNYFNFLVPAFAKGYGFWDTCLANSLAAPDKRGVFYLTAVCATFALMLCRRVPIFLPLSVFTLSSIIPYLMQFKGWNYHDIPVFAGASLLAGGLLGYLLGQTARLVKVRCMTEHLPLMVVVATSGFCFMNGMEEVASVKGERQFDLSRLGYKGSSPWSDIDSPFTDYLLKYTRPGDAVIFISNGVSPGYPLLTQFALAPGSRHLHCCILSVFQFIKEAEPDNAEARKLLSREPEVIEQYGIDIAAKKPVLIFIQEAPVISYLNPYDFFGKYMKSYERLGSAANFSVYRRVD